MIPSYLQGKELPKHIQVALSLIGTKEIVGSRHSDIILGWAKELGLEKVYTNDELAWCGLFFAYVMKEANRRVDLNTKDAYDYLRAAKYANMPNVTRVPKGEEKMGDILIFQRPGGGHIGWYVYGNNKNFGVLGGNQGNAVSVVEISKARLTHALRPSYISYRPYELIVSNGGVVSTNEA